MAVSIFRNMEEGRDVTLGCVGPVSFSQAVKALILANGMAGPVGKMFLLMPYFAMGEVNRKVQTESGEVTVIRMRVMEAVLQAPSVDGGS